MSAPVTDPASKAEPKPERRASTNERKEKKHKHKEGKTKEKKEKRDSARLDTPTSPGRGSTGGGPPLPPPALTKYEVGKQIGGITLGGEFHYTIAEAKVKEGGKSALWKTIRKTTDPQLGDQPTWALRKDLAAAQQLTHTRLAQLLDCYEDGENFYLAYECFPERFPKSNAFGEASARRFAVQILEILEYLHSKGVSGSKLELKPEKLYLLSDGTIKMEDVGINQAAYPTEDKLRSIGKGSRSCYVSPELLMCEPETQEVAESADIWALGGLIYFFVTGRPPFDADSEPALFKKIIAGADEVKFPPEQFSEETKALIKQLLSKDLKKRPSLKQLRENPWFKGR